MTRDDLAFEMFLARIERQGDGVDRALWARRAGLAGLSWGVLRLRAIVIWSAKTTRSCWAELRSAFHSIDVRETRLVFVKNDRLPALERE